MSTITLPGGNDKGKAISDPSVSERTLSWWAENAKQQDLRDACAAELARRGGGGAPQKRPPAAAQGGRSQQAIQRAQQGQVVAGSFGDAKTVNARLREMSDEYHLVAPATVCSSLPEGCEVAISLVSVNSDASPNGPGDVYPTGGGKLGLAKATLDRIAAASGVTWDPQLCRRTDDGRDPHYVAFTAVGYVRNFDGSIRTLTGSKEMDLRPGSPQVDAFHDRAKDGKDAEKQIREMRLHILGHAETKAKLRAIRSMGIKTSYTKTDVEKPFAVARLMFTGRTEDPELRREFALLNARGMLGGIAALYGGSTGTPLAQPAPAAAPQLSAPMTPRALEDDDYLPPEPTPHQVATTGTGNDVESSPDATPDGPPAGYESDYDRGPSAENY